MCVLTTNLSLIIDTLAVPKSIQLWRRNSTKQQGLAVMPVIFNVTVTYKASMVLDFSDTLRGHQGSSV